MGTKKITLANIKAGTAEITANVLIGDSPRAHNVYYDRHGFTIPENLKVLGDLGYDFSEVESTLAEQWANLEELQKKQALDAFVDKYYQKYSESWMHKIKAPGVSVEPASWESMVSSTRMMRYYEHVKVKYNGYDGTITLDSDKYRLSSWQVTKRDRSYKNYSTAIEKFKELVDEIVKQKEAVKARKNRENAARESKVKEFSDLFGNCEVKNTVSYAGRRSWDNYKYYVTSEKGQKLSIEDTGDDTYTLNGIRELSEGEVLLILSF